MAVDQADARALDQMDRPRCERRGAVTMVVTLLYDRSGFTGPVAQLVPVAGGLALVDQDDAVVDVPGHVFGRWSEVLMADDVVTVLETATRHEDLAAVRWWAAVVWNGD